MGTSLDVGVAHVEEHAVDVAHVAPVLVGELVVAGKQEESHAKGNKKSKAARIPHLTTGIAGASRNLCQAFLCRDVSIPIPK